MGVGNIRSACVKFHFPASGGLMSVQMTISINGQVDRTFPDIAWQSGMDVQQAMETAFGSESGYDFALQYFGPDLGYEPIMIDNIFQQPGTDTFLFWPS